MPNLYSIPAGASLADVAAQFVLSRVPANRLDQALLLVPTRRSCVVMREALMRALGEKASLLPRMLPLAESETLLLHALGPRALPLLQQIPPAMSEAQHRFLLARQVQRFEQGRSGVPCSLNHALALADLLKQLQEQWQRYEIRMDARMLSGLVHGDLATHWQQSVDFLQIIVTHWSKLEEALGMTVAIAREMRCLQTLTAHWEKEPPEMPVFVIGSTGSQPATARLLKAVASARDGHVILPGMLSDVPAQHWEEIAAGHPLYHLKALLDPWGMSPSDVTPLAPSPTSIWHEVLSPVSHMPAWLASVHRPQPQGIRLLACTHLEEEAQAIALLLREGLEQGHCRVALVTPDEGLMARVAIHLAREGITPDRLRVGSLAQSESAGMWLALALAIAEPERALAQRSLLHHCAFALGSDLLEGLAAAWHGVNRSGAGRLPRHDNALKNAADYAVATSMMRDIATLSSGIFVASDWVRHCRIFLQSYQRIAMGDQESVDALLDTLGQADDLGMLDAADFLKLLMDQFSAPWRDAGLRADPRVLMLTPVEARLEQFDRVVLGSMTDDVWPGVSPANPWLNLAMQERLGMPSPAEQVSLVAHDVLMLASGREVFFTYSLRRDGSPATRSRFIERLLAWCASHGIAEASMEASYCLQWLHQRDAAMEYAPEPPAMPRPLKSERPKRLPVTDIDRLIADPYLIYAKHVLNFRALDAMDAAPGASDFGSLAHKAMQALAAHWEERGRSASESDLAAIAQQALRDFSDRPNVDCFWRTRLIHGLRFVNALEAERRTAGAVISSEKEVVGEMAGITLYGRIDRLENRAGKACVVDYKTGKAPTESEIRDGRALQLLVYAMLVADDNMTPDAAEYWQLPRLAGDGKVIPLRDLESYLPEYEAAIQSVLEKIQREETPFLATGEDRESEAYEGIHRRGEWA